MQKFLLNKEVVPSFSHITSDLRSYVRKRTAVGSRVELPDSLNSKDASFFETILDHRIIGC